MSSPSLDVPADDVVISLPRRRDPKGYSIQNGVGRTPAATELGAPRPRSQARLRLRPPHPADVAQSRLFAEFLLTEIDDLEDRAAVAERHRSRRADRHPDEAGTLPHELKELRHRIAEARRLLDALHQRFPSD